MSWNVWTVNGKLDIGWQVCSRLASGRDSHFFTSCLCTRKCLLSISLCIFSWFLMFLSRQDIPAWKSPDYNVKYQTPGALWTSIWNWNPTQTALKPGIRSCWLGNNVTPCVTEIIGWGQKHWRTLSMRVTSDSYPPHWLRVSFFVCKIIFLFLFRLRIQKKGKKMFLKVMTSAGFFLASETNVWQKRKKWSVFSCRNVFTVKFDTRLLFSFKAHMCPSWTKNRKVANQTFCWLLWRKEATTVSETEIVEHITKDKKHVHSNVGLRLVLSVPRGFFFLPWERRRKWAFAKRASLGGLISSYFWHGSLAFVFLDFFSKIACFVRSQ